MLRYSCASLAPLAPNILFLGTDWVVTGGYQFGEPMQDRQLVLYDINSRWANFVLNIINLIKNENKEVLTAFFLLREGEPQVDIEL